MAYSPLGIDRAEQKRILDHETTRSIAARHNATPSQIALAWIFRHPDLIVIPKSSSPEHIRENRAALDIKLTAREVEELDQAFPPPQRKIPLETS